MAVGLGPSKGKDFATSLGPELVCLDELADCYRGGRLPPGDDRRGQWPRAVERQLRLDVLDLASVLAHASRDATLQPGDVLGSGTVGYRLHPRV